MDAEPRSLRPFVLIATAFVVMGSVAGFMMWMLAREQEQRGRGEGPPAGSLREVSLHPVAFPDSVPPMERRRLTALIDAALAGPDGNTITTAEQEAAAQGMAIVPAALDRLHSLSIAPGFADPAGRQKVRVLDRLLRAVQKRFVPASPPLRPAADSPDGRADLLARSWFRWWEDLASDDGPRKGPR